MLDTQRLHILLERHWDNVLAPDERAELEDMLRATAQARSIYWEQAAWQAAMGAWGEADWGRQASERSDQTARSAPPIRDPRRRPPPPWAAIWAAITVASATALAAAAWWGLGSARPPTNATASGAISPRHVAVITAVEEPVWQGPAFALGQSLPACRLAIAAGSVEITFASGARVLLRGPAEFGVLSPLRGELVRGDLAARVPPGAEGFVVDTPSVEVVDLGTAFGVRVGDDGTADVRVFEGVVEARAEVHAPEGQAFTRLEQDMARRFLPDGVSSSESPTTSDEFPLLAPDAPDRPVTTGAIKLLRSPPSSLVALESDDFILMFQERAGVDVSPGCRVDVVAPGLYGKSPRRPSRPLNTAACVDSYFLHCDTLPRPNLERPRDSRGAEMRLEGSVTFTRPVVAVLLQRDSLDASDDTLGLGAGVYPTRGDAFRGVELFDKDKVVLSSDRKTLTVSLLVRAQKGRDQIRVLVESE